MRRVRFSPLWALLSALVSACTADRPSPPPASQESPAALEERPGVRSHYAVATQHAAATQAAAEVLERGGHAVDAAITAALVLGVAAPDCSGLGGGGFALVWDNQEKRTTLLDFRESAPSDLKAEQLDEELSRGRPQRRGLRVGIPGELAGLAELHRRFGRRPFAEDVEPAVELAQSGAPVGASLARNAFAFRASLKGFPLLSTLFERSGSGPVYVGYSVRREKLAATLRAIADQGPRAFYEGDVAEEMVKVVQANGGVMSLADLAAYRPIERAPLEVRWGDFDVVTVAPPSAGGLLLAETLEVAPPGQLKSLGHNTGAYVHTLAEAFRGALADRIQNIGDPAFVQSHIAQLLAEPRLELRKAGMTPNRTHALPGSPIQEHGTSHLVIADGDGNVVSLTTTIGDAFGSLLALPESGVLLNDELVDFTTQRQYARFSHPTEAAPNAPRPGARPVSSMTPSIVFEQGKPVLAMGGAGGLHIATGVTQVLLSSLVFRHPLSEAVAAPRFHTPYEGYTVELEFGTPKGVAADLRERGERVDTTANFSAVQALSVSYSEDGETRFSATADPRFGGSAVTR